jgi:hypothetical protein
VWNLLAIHAKRVTIQKKDADLARLIRGHYDPQNHGDVVVVAREENNRRLGIKPASRRGEVPSTSNT